MPDIFSLRYFFLLLQRYTLSIPSSDTTTTSKKRRVTLSRHFTTLFMICVSCWRGLLSRNLSTKILVVEADRVISTSFLIWYTWPYMSWTRKYDAVPNMAAFLQREVIIQSNIVIFLVLVYVALRNPSQRLLKKLIPLGSSPHLKLVLIIIQCWK
jgi:hypothetical protein